MPSDMRPVRWTNTEWVFHLGGCELNKNTGLGDVIQCVTVYYVFILINNEFDVSDTRQFN